MIQQANDVLDNIDSMEVRKEVIESAQGSEFLFCVTQIYKVVCMIKTSMHAFCK